MVQVKILYNHFRFTNNWWAKNMWNNFDFIIIVDEVVLILMGCNWNYFRFSCSTIEVVISTFCGAGLNFAQSVLIHQQLTRKKNVQNDCDFINIVNRLVLLLISLDCFEIGNTYFSFYFLYHRTWSKYLLWCRSRFCTTSSDSRTFGYNSYFRFFWLHQRMWNMCILWCMWRLCTSFDPSKFGQKKIILQIFFWPIVGRSKEFGTKSWFPPQKVKQEIKIGTIKWAIPYVDGRNFKLFVIKYVDSMVLSCLVISNFTRRVVY